MGAIPHPWGVRLLTELNNQSKMVAVSKKFHRQKKKVQDIQNHSPLILLWLICFSKEYIGSYCGIIWFNSIDSGHRLYP